MKGKFMNECLNKWRKIGSRIIPSGSRECCQESGSRSSEYENCSIPRDVPKGHLVVYVGENYRRYVIKISLLNHPLFKALLDQAREEYDYTADSKLCIPCDEYLFLCVLQCATSSTEGRRMSFCL